MCSNLPSILSLRILVDWKESRYASSVYSSTLDPLILECGCGVWPLLLSRPCWSSAITGSDCCRVSAGRRLQSCTPAVGV